MVTATKLPCSYDDGAISGSGRIKMYVFADKWIQDFELLEWPILSMVRLFKQVILD